MKKYRALIIAVVILVLVGMSIGGSYNNIIRLDEASQSAWSQVENVYQRRLDLIDNLVNTVKGYANFEKETLTEVIEARAKATSTNVNFGKLNANSIKQFQQAQTGLSSALSRLMVVVERYPELKANQNFLELQSQLEGTENRIAVERMKFNEAVKKYNTKIRSFPTNLLSGVLGFQSKAYFSSDNGANKVPKVKF